MSRRTLILVIIAAGIWAFVFVFYLWPMLFGQGGSVKTSSKVQPSRSVVLKVPVLELKEATPVSLNLNLKPFELNEQQEFTRLIFETPRGLNERMFPYRYVGYARSGDGMVVFLESGERIIKVRTGEMFGSYMILHVSELGLLVLDTSQQKVVVIR